MHTAFPVQPATKTNQRWLDLGSCAADLTTLNLCHHILVSASPTVIYKFPLSISHFTDVPVFFLFPNLTISIISERRSNTSLNRRVFSSFLLYFKRRVSLIDRFRKFKLFFFSPAKIKWLKGTLYSATNHVPPYDFVRWWWYFKIMSRSSKYSLPICLPAVNHGGRSAWNVSPYISISVKLNIVQPSVFQGDENNFRLVNS